MASRLGGGKRPVPLDGVARAVADALGAFGIELFRRAKVYLDEHIVSATSVDQLVEAIAERRGFVRVCMCDADRCEETLRRASGASPRVVADEAPAGPCLVCGGAASQVAYYARAY